MTYVNTTECDKFVLDKIVADEIKNQEASSIFVIWASNKVPTQTIMEYMRVGCPQRIKHIIEMYC